MEPTQETKDRIDAFLAEYKVLIEKHKVDFIAFPMFIPDGTGGFKVVIQQQPVDTSQTPTVSPKEFIPQ